MSDAREYYERWATEYYLEERARLREVVASVLRDRHDWRIDQIMSDVILAKLPGVLRTWDPSLGSALDSHVRRNLRWYVFKHLKAADRRRDTEGLWDEEHDDNVEGRDPGFEDVDVADAMGVLEGELSKADMLLLERRFGEGWTVQRMADASCVSRNIVYKRLRKALANARAALGEEVDDDD